MVAQPGRIQVTLELFRRSRRAADRLRRAFGGSIAELPLDWQERFFAAHRTKRLHIGKRLTLAGDERHLSEATPSALIIPAGAAFGTGEHATTAMSLRILERVSRPLEPGWRMLDAGTGSGVLALAACRFGAGQVVAIDNDRTAISTARQNAKGNGIRGVHFVVGDVKDSLRGTFDIIAANLYSELLEALLPQFRRSVAQSGRVILSGVLREQERQLTRALRSNDLRVIESRRRGKWVALLAAPGSK